jgi:hypothetical protein
VQSQHPGASTGPAQRPGVRLQQQKQGKA